MPRRSTSKVFVLPLRKFVKFLCNNRGCGGVQPRPVRQPWEAKQYGYPKSVRKTRSPVPHRVHFPDRNGTEHLKRKHGLCWYQPP